MFCRYSIRFGQILKIPKFSERKTNLTLLKTIKQGLSVLWRAITAFALIICEWVINRNTIYSSEIAVRVVKFRIQNIKKKIKINAILKHNYGGSLRHSTHMLTNPTLSIDKLPILPVNCCGTNPTWSGTFVTCRDGRKIDFLDFLSIRPV